MTLSDVKAYLRVDHDEDDNSIRDLLTAAETYLRRLCQPWVDDSSDEIILDELPVDFQMAVKLLVAHWYDTRRVTDHKHHAEIPFSVSALIANFRG
jgi:uncharacterized phage protein (predicted DNA packaging)